MQGCREKAHTLPVRLNSNTMPQLKALYKVIEYIFDRNASLLPAYFIVTEIQKDYPDNNHWPHWVSFTYCDCDECGLKRDYSVFRIIPLRCFYLVVIPLSFV